MKKFTLSVTAIAVVMSVLTLCGCETTVSLEETTTKKGPSTTVAPPTAVVDVTNEEGTVLATETVTLTMSAQDVEEEKNFFVPATQVKGDSNISNDRLQQALQQQQAAQNQNKKPQATDKDEETTKKTDKSEDEKTTKKSDKVEKTTKKPDKAEKTTKNPNKTEKTTKQSNKTENTTTTKKPEKTEEHTTKPVVESTTKPEKVEHTTEEATTQETTSEPVETAPIVQDDAAVLRSDQYMISARLVDSEGVAGTYKIAKNGKRSSVSLVYNGVPMIVILGEEEWYVLSVEDKTYITIPKEMIKENASDDEMAELLMDDPFNFEREIVAETTETIDGIEYNVVEYVDGNKDYFIGKTIIKTTATDNSVMYYDTVSPFAPESLFVPPEDYTETEVNQENAAEIMSSIDPSATVPTKAETTAVVEEKTEAPAQEPAGEPAEANLEGSVDEAVDE